MNQKQWKDSVRRGRILAVAERNTRWEVADLILESFPFGTTTKTTGVFARLDEWLRACEFDISLGNAKWMRWTARQWPTEHRVKASFFTHTILSGNPDRFLLIKDGMTSSEAEAVHSGRQLQHLASKGSVVDYLGAARSFLRTARKHRSKKQPTGEYAEELGRVIAEAEAELAEWIEWAGMDEQDALLAA